MITNGLKIKMVYDLVCDRINNDFIVKLSDSVLLGCIGLAIEEYLDAMPQILKLKFQLMLYDIKARKDRKQFYEVVSYSSQI